MGRRDETRAVRPRDNPALSRRDDQIVQKKVKTKSSGAPSLLVSPVGVLLHYRFVQMRAPPTRALKRRQTTRQVTSSKCSFLCRFMISSTRNFHSGTSGTIPRVRHQITTDPTGLSWHEVSAGLTWHEVSTVRSRADAGMSHALGKKHWSGSFLA